MFIFLIELRLPGVLSKLGSYTNEIYANPDHIHILCSLPRTITIADLLSRVKSSSSKCLSAEALAQAGLKTKGVENFGWQDVYGIFSLSASKVFVVEKYMFPTLKGKASRNSFD